MYLKDNITRLAVIAFEKEGSLSISQCGELKKVYLNAYQKKGGADIFPPNEQIYFYNNVHAESDKNLLHLIKILKFCSDEEALELISEWEKSWLENMDKAPFVLGHIGVFKINDGKIDFYTSGKTFYDFLPVVKSNYKGKYNVQLPGSRFEKRAEIKEIRTAKKRGVLVPALWTLLLIAFGIAFFFWKGPFSQIFTDGKYPERKLVNVAPKSYQDTEGVVYFSDTNESTIEKENSETTTQKAEESRNKGNVEENAVEDININPSLEAKQCTLIVGAFANQGNVARMTEKLKNLDMIPVVLKRNTLTLVGARVNCSETEKEVTTIRDEVEPNAWMYKN
ncbi:hypothetical protein [Membranihabitans maritimus]|uniref:hypothetical protein n=1 Tax=Membranihabitans maritimus TaxID=2904244 RepID=UPI001F313716|nr:hypothetical protein [Membranihabitans maritimus]